MAKIIESGRVKIYDESGRLVEERDATADDLIEVLLDKLSSEYEIAGKMIAGNQVFEFRLKIVKASG